MARIPHGKILRRAVALPLARENPRAAVARDFYGIIDAARIDHDNFRGERHGRKAVAQLRGCVAGDDTKADGERPGHAPKSTRNGLLRGRLSCAHSTWFPLAHRTG